METKHVIIRPSAREFALMNEGLGFTPSELAIWKKLRIKRRVLWTERGKIQKTISQIDRSLAPMKNRGECPNATIEERRKNHYELTRLTWPIWDCDGPIQLMEQKLETALPGYAVASCQKLTTGMSILPRELRDIVYEYLLDDQLRDFAHSYAEVLVKMPPAQRPYAMQSRLKFFSKPPHFMDADIVGPHFGSEIYFRAAEFVRKTSQSDIMMEPEEGSRYLTERIPGTEVPISSFFKSLKLSIRPYTYFEGSDLGKGVFNSYCRKAISDLGEARHENRGALRDLAVMEDEDWIVFGSYFRKMIFNLAKAQQENGGVLHVTVSEGFIGYPWPRCRQIFQSVAGELSRSEFGAVGVEIQNMKLVYSLDPSS